MLNGELSKYFSDDKNRTATIVRDERILKVVFEDHITNRTFFLYYNSIESAENAAEDFVMYES